MVRGTLGMMHASYSPLPKPGPLPILPGAQIIGLIKNRMSGITLSRHAYADVLRTIYNDLFDATTQEGKRDARAVNVWAARPLSRVVLDDFKKCLPGFNAWCFVLESTTLPEGSLDACANVNQVWAPSSFVRDVCIAGGMPAEKVFLVPYYLPGPERPRVPSAAGSPFTVLASWDGRSSINRKHVLKAIEAFRVAFPGDCGASLKLKTRDLSPENLALVMGAIEGDSRIALDMTTTETVDEIFDGADVLLHLHRAEGYGRHVIEAMLRRLPVILTAYSGPMDWATPENTWQVPFDLVETAQSEFQYPQGGKWAEVRVGAAAAALRSVRWQSAASMRATLDAAEISALKHCSLERSRSAMIQALKAGGVL